MSLKTFALALAAIACASPLESPNKASNDDPCEPCQPQGSSGLTPPAIGGDLSSLYTDVLSSVNGIHFKRSPASLFVRDSGFCCRASLNCVNVQSLNIPMCYDKYTTNFAFADGSYGSLTTGEYSSGGNTANLLTGAYTSNGQSGNIYSADPADKPNTSTLSIPPQYTGTGVGSAVPANQLGSIIVYTTVIPGTTISGPTTVPGSVRVATISGVPISTSVPARTITQATTIAEQTTVVTNTVQAAASASSTGAAGRVVGEAGMGVFGALMYALYVL
ncbi:hypothetical protein EK21DRAFT_69209 [Setomelanomma holmii]|uniref:Uncharacterized protein n=1 Tax=Setomelanomma holmii TaxID=210430 RepID=A0A9P4LM94_9PLEO|nr:hypothetical protein EK21DRAFT_69209 [Setomelanomma holmii]